MSGASVFRRLPCGRLPPSAAFALGFHETFGPNPYKLGLSADDETLAPVWEKYRAHMGFADDDAEGDFWADNPGESDAFSERVLACLMFLKGPVRVDVS